MLELKLPLEVPYRQVVIDYMNLVFSNSPESGRYWSTAIKGDMERLFNFKTWFAEEGSGSFSLQMKVCCVVNCSI